MALKDYEGIHKRRPNDKDAKLKYSECKKIVQQIAFQKAIAVEENRKSVADSIDLESMPVEDKYTGPRISESGIDLNFMKVNILYISCLKLQHSLLFKGHRFKYCHAMF